MLKILIASQNGLKLKIMSNVLSPERDASGKMSNTLSPNNSTALWIDIKNIVLNLPVNCYSIIIDINEDQHSLNLLYLILEVK